MDHEQTRVPEVIFKTRVRDELIGGENPFRWQDSSTKELFAGRRIVAFGLPGAFTPTCDSTHLPGYEAAYDDIKAAGIDDIFCISVNDAFVMKQWADRLGVKKVKLLPDGNADFTRLIGMLVKKENLGFGLRSWRYSMYLDDSVIKKMFIEPGFSDNCPDDPFVVSDAQTMLAFLRT